MTVNVNTTFSLYSYAFAASFKTHANANAARVNDPTLEDIGDPSNLVNYLPDNGVTDHMTPRLADLYEIEEETNLAVEVADGHIIPCNISGKIKLRMLDDEGKEMEAVLINVCTYLALIGYCSYQLWSHGYFQENRDSLVFQRRWIFNFSASQPW